MPAKLKTVTKSSPGKTIEIFEGMTIKEFAEQCGEKITIVQRILENDVGEKVDSEFDTLSIDIAEMVAMVIFLFFYAYITFCFGLFAGMVKPKCLTNTKAFIFVYLMDKFL